VQLVSDWITKFKFIWAPIFLIGGFVIALWGKQIFHIICFLVGSFVSATLLLLVFYSNFMTANTKTGVAWTVFALGILCGLIGGYVLYKLQRLAGALFAAWGGFLLGMVLARLVGLKDFTIAFWLFNFLLSLFSAVLSWIFYYHVVILSTAFIGSYVLVRGVSLYTGGFPNELDYIRKA